MKTVNSVERKRVTKRFVGFYAVSVALLALVFAALSFGNSDKQLTGFKPLRSEMIDVSIAEQEQILSASTPLQVAYSKLLSFDEEYTSLLTQPNSTARLESLRINIANAEMQLDKTIDNLRQFQRGLGAGASGRIVDLIAGTYTAAKNTRKGVNIGKNPIVMDSRKEPGEQVIAKLNAEILTKDKRIAQLEKMVLGSDESDKIEEAGILEQNVNLRTAITEARKKSEQAIEQASTLKRENIRLNERINEFQRNSVTGSNPELTASSRVESLAADLSFMQVDCNLTRADAKQIISNSRQRRELLAEALKILNTLNKSGNPAVRKKATEKMAALNYIANNVRE